MAYIRKLPSGKFQATVRHPSGKRITRTDSLKRVVKDWADEQERQMRSGQPIAAQNARRITVDSWWTRWQKSRNVEPRTKAKNESHWRNHLRPHWGTWPLSSIGRLDVQTWVKDMTRAGAGPDTVHACYNLLAGMLTDAVLEGLLAVSPCRQVDLPKIVKPPVRSLTEDEYEAIQMALGARTLRVPRTTRHEPDPQAAMWQAFVALGCFSGPRPGELAGLDVPAVDMGRGLVHVSQVMTRDGMRAYPKTGASNRWVPFPPEVGELLWPLIADRAAGPVFVSPEGGRVDDRNFARRVWAPALRSAGVPAGRPYLMRHTCASWLAQDGVPDRMIAQILGHSSTRMLGVYAHLDPERHDRIREAWARRIPKAADAGDADLTHGPRVTHP